MFKHPLDHSVRYYNRSHHSKITYYLFQLHKLFGWEKNSRSCSSPASSSTKGTHYHIEVIINLDQVEPPASIATIASMDALETEPAPVAEEKLDDVRQYLEGILCSFFHLVLLWL